MREGGREGGGGGGVVASSPGCLGEVAAWKKLSHLLCMSHGRMSPLGQNYRHSPSLVGGGEGGQVLSRKD